MCFNGGMTNQSTSRRVWVETVYENPSSVERECYSTRETAERVVAGRLDPMSDEWEYRQVVSSKIL